MFNTVMLISVVYYWKNRPTLDVAEGMNMVIEQSDILLSIQLESKYVGGTSWYEFYLK